MDMIGGNSSTPERRGVDDWFSARRFAALLALLIVAMFPDVALGLKTFVFRDYSLFGYPLAHYHHAQFWKGEIPLWNPLNNCGLPFLAQWNTLVLYPLALIYLLLPLPWSLGVFCLLHLFLAGMGMYVLAREWTNRPLAAAVAGVAFTFNGLTLACMMWPNNIAALGWMPWVWLWAGRAWRLGGGRRVVRAALVAAAQMLAGAPEMACFTWLGLLGWWAVQWLQAGSGRLRFTGRALAVGVLVAGLSTAQLLPFLDLLQHSQRHSGFGGTAWSMAPTGWANLLVPLFRCVQTSSGVFMQHEQGWTTSYYLGLGALALAVLAVWRVRQAPVALLGLALLLSLVLALGKAGHLYPWLEAALPLGFMRFPVKWVVVAAFVVPLLAALGLKHWLEPDAEEHRRCERRVALLGAALLALVAGILWFAVRHPGLWEQPHLTVRNGLWRGAFLVLVLAALFGMSRVSRPTWRLGLQMGVILLIALDGMTHVPRQNPTVQMEAYYIGLPPLREMNPKPRHGQSRAMLLYEARKGLHSRMLTNRFEAQLIFRLGLYANVNLLEDLPKLDGFYSLYFPEEQAVRDRDRLEGTNGLHQGVADFLGVSQTVDERLEWSPRASWMPMVTAGQQPRFTGPEQTLAEMFRPDFDARRVVYLPPEAQTAIRVTNQTDARVVACTAQAQRVDCVVESSQPSLVVLAQAFYHPWKAQVDGRPVPLWRANHAFQAVEVPAGQHHVTLVYRDTAFLLGAIVSGLTLVICGVIWRRSRRLTARSQAPVAAGLWPGDASDQRQAA
jgi:hypothetical protein